ncbi:MAG TPA: cyclic nucleotide-binding domain-containing protein [Vicinamibacterales bacterium]|jgi:CRP-like cAMP-binding protein
MPDTRPDLLKSMSAGDADAVLALGSRLTLSSGAVLFELGIQADQLYVIDRGRVNLTLPMQVFGHEEDILVEERVAGQTLGWSALIPPHRFTLKATAQIDTELLAFRRMALLDYFAAHPDVGYAVVGNVAATVGQRLQVFQAMWLREMKRVLELSRGTGSAA